MNDTKRMDSLDLLRGMIMVLMAIDHVRVYAGVPTYGEPTVFMTRWITHFVAPGFAFFAGAAAFLHGRRLGDMRALAKYLWTRGAILVVLELTVLRFFWTFNFDYAHYSLAGVIWMLGWCMVLLSFLVRFSPRSVGIFGVVVIFFQQILGVLRLLPESLSPIGSILYLGGELPGHIKILYVLVPWIGVMAAGYGFGTILLWPDAERRRQCFRIGLIATFAFVVLATIKALMQGGGDGEALWMRVLGQQKYPASSLFLMMTLGPLIALIPWAENAKGRRVWNWLTTFGRVPMFYYLIHIPTIHVAAMIVSLVRQGSVNPWLFGNHPMAPPEVPVGYMWSLGLLYFVWVLCLIALYFPSRWYARRKATKRYRWLSYV